MLKTATTILFEDGPLELLRAVKRNLLPKRLASARPNEADMAFDVLHAEDSWGVMVDVGAHYGGTLRRFAHAGWQVYAFEPDSVNRQRMLERGYGDMPNVKIDTRALADWWGEGIPFFRSEESSGISGLSAFHPTHVQSEMVDMTTLDLFAREQAVEKVDFLKIDTEGFDLFVLKGVPWERFQPRLILCEFEDRKTVPLGYNFHDLAQYLEAQGYRLIVSEWFPIKRYGIPHDWRRFAIYPCELEDPAAWGNIFAAKKSLYFALAKTCGLQFQDKAVNGAEGRS
jgi:FkbM family methyltransferase